MGALHTMYYILIYTLAFCLLLWVLFPTVYQSNIRFQNLIYVLILVLCIDVEEHNITWVWPEALPILKIQVCTYQVWCGNWGNTTYILTPSQYEYEVLYWWYEGMLFLELGMDRLYYLKFCGVKRWSNVVDVWSHKLHKFP
jgi:hypothetical protein